MQDSIKKPVHLQGSDGLWGTYNNQAGLTCSPDGYMLIIAPPEMGRLDDFTAQQESGFWNMMFATGTAGLVDPAARGMNMPPVSDDQSSSQTEYTFMCAMNDGTAAWQTVGTVHGHLIWLSRAAGFGNIQKRLMAERALLTGSPYEPLGSIEVVFTDDPAQDLRDARQNLRDHFSASTRPDELSFSIYSKYAVSAGSCKKSMIVEAWNAVHSSLFSLSNVVRAWNGLTQKVTSPHAMGLNVRSFLPE